LHAKRVDALAGATLGVMAGASLAVAMIGQALAQARGLVTKHAVKQVDRLMSNQGIDVWDSFARWVPQQVGAQQDILVAMDWTDFDHDGQSTLVLSLVTGHGRAAPLIWLTVWKEEIATRRNDYEDACLRRLAETVPPGCRVTILADRGFGDQKLFAFLGELGFGYIIRFRGNIHVTDADGQTRPAAEWVGKGGRARKLRDARVTAQGRQVGAVVCVHAKGMKEPWCLAASDPEATAAVLVNHYARRWTIDIDQSWRLSRIKGRVVSHVRSHVAALRLSVPTSRARRAGAARQRCALHQIFRQSVEPRLINRLQLLQLRRGIVPALRLAATIGGFAVADLRRALRLSSPVAGLSLCMGHRRAQQGLRSWFHGLRCPFIARQLVT
jgi:hypothetical protein